MEKFCLKRDNFQTNSSLVDLRKNQNFVDVTLFGDDGQHIKAHKVILSASSDFFKDNFIIADHPNPMIFLSGFDSKLICAILDYIYEGEVTLFQDDFEAFIDCARKLKIEELNVSFDEHQKDLENEISHDNLNTKVEISHNNLNSKVDLIKEEPSQEILSSPVPIRKYKTNGTLALHDDKAKKAIENLIIESHDGWFCKDCGKSTASKSNMRKHVEIHVDGLSYQCKICSNIYNSRMKLDLHKKKFHHKNK